MTASGGSRSTKRSRNDPTSDPSAGSKKTTTPFEASKCHLVERLATLPTLHESQKTYILDTHVQYVKLRKNLKNLLDRRKKTAVDGYIIKSTGFKFDLKCSDKLYEEQEKEVNALRESCKLAIDKMQQTIRKEVVKLIDFEIDSVKLRIQNLFADALLLIANTLAILDPAIATYDAHDLYRRCLDSNQHAPSLLKHSCFSDSNAFYKHVFDAEETANPSPPASQESDGPAPYTKPAEFDEDDYQVSGTNASLSTFLTVCTCLFTTSWDTYLKSELDIEMKQTVHKYIQTIQTASASEATAMDTDEVQEKDNKTLEETVRRAVETEGKKLRAEFNKSLNARLPKNQLRGALKTSASSTKKSVSFDETGNGKQAADPAKGSSKGSRRRGKANASSNKNKQRSKQRGRR